jgi:two-component system OmpR family sensor kinase
VIRSLRIRLILLLGVAILLATAVQFAASFEAATEEAGKLFDYHMQRMALAFQQGGFEQADWYSARGPSQISFDFVIQVWGDDSTRVVQSREYVILPRQGKLGYSTVTLANGEWRVYAVQTGSRTVQVAQKLSTRRERAFSLALHSVWPVIPVSLLLFAAAWWAISSALSPLNRIGRELAGRSIDSLAPVSAAGVPSEVAGLVDELNSLLGRVAHGLQSQQRFVADAAHELRSPITALKLQVQTLLRSRDDIARAQAIQRLLGGVDRASRLVEQLLALAREEPASPGTKPCETILAESMTLALADVAPLAAARQIELKVAALPDLQVIGDPDSLQILARNLLDNAIRYTPEHGIVRMSLMAGARTATLTVEDSGPGIAMADRRRVFDRFYRVPGTSPTGSGLGLAIVKAIADRHGAVVELTDSMLGGVSIKIVFPLP